MPFPLIDLDEISSVSNKEEVASKEEGEHLRESLSQMDNPIVEEEEYQLDEFEPEEHPQPKDDEEVDVVSEKKEMVPSEKEEEGDGEWEQVSKWDEVQSEERPVSQESKVVSDLIHEDEKKRVPEAVTKNANPSW